ncbi:hypothetical protein BDZ91DRAFT_721213 [Kalaharituber pfeilii]|nr:hypothetical protein BDZ91DRAFT_721213 [Kalaharituber pfeilii]
MATQYNDLNQMNPYQQHFGHRQHQQRNESNQMNPYQQHFGHQISLPTYDYQRPHSAPGQDSQVRTLPPPPQFLPGGPTSYQSQVPGTLASPSPYKTFFISSRDDRKKLVFTTTPFPQTETDDVMLYIVAPNKSSSSWRALVHGGPNPKLFREETGERASRSPVLATITRSSFWKKFVVGMHNGSDMEVAHVPGFGQRGYIFTLGGSDEGAKGKTYRWCGTRMYSKGIGKLGCKGMDVDLKLVGLETKAIIATYEKKWSFSSYASPSTEKKKLKDGRTPVGCLHILQQNLPVGMDELIVLLTGYCIIEAEHRKRDLIWEALEEGAGGA